MLNKADSSAAWAIGGALVLFFIGGLITTVVPPAAGPWVVSRAVTLGAPVAAATLMPGIVAVRVPLEAVRV